jgi:hypothetical protein
LPRSGGNSSAPGSCGIFFFGINPENRPFFLQKQQYSYFVSTMAFIPFVQIPSGQTHPDYDNIRGDGFIAYYVEKYSSDRRLLFGHLFENRIIRPFVQRTYKGGTKMLQRSLLLILVVCLGVVFTGAQSPGGDASDGLIAGAGDIAGTVLDPRTGNPIQGVVVDIMLPNGNPSGIPPATTNAQGKFTFSSITDTDYMLVIEDPNYITTKIWTTVTDGSMTTLTPIHYLRHPVLYHGTACGDIYDVLTGDLIPNVSIKFRRGINAPITEPVVYTDSTGIWGYWKLQNMEAGVYTGYTSKNGYEDGTFNVYVMGNEEICNQNGAMSPVVEEDELRIILQWGASPSDLDSHLWAYHHGCAVANPFHQYFSSIGHACSTWFALDLDDTSSYGPETSTIYKTSDGFSPRINQPYRFAVHDYSNRSSGTSSAMSNSPGLRVDAITSQGTTTFYMPTNTPATVWSVFDAEFDGTVWHFTTVNDFYFESDPGSVY